MDIVHWINEKVAFIHGRQINVDNLSYLSVIEMLYLYGEISHTFGIHIPSKYIITDVFSSISKLAACIEGLLPE